MVSPSCFIFRNIFLRPLLLSAYLRPYLWINAASFNDLRAPVQPITSMHNPRSYSYSDPFPKSLEHEQ